MTVKLAHRRDTSLHEFAAQSEAPDIRMGGHPPDGWLIIAYPRSRDTQAGLAAPGLVQCKEMMTLQILGVRIEVDALLFDDEDLLTKTQDRVQLCGPERLE